MSAPRAIVKVFCKAPVPGSVKSRLAADIGDDKATEIHTRLALHCLDTVTRLDNISVELWCSPNTEDAFFKYCRTGYNISLEKQNDGDLGRRMYHAFKDHFDGPKIIVGTDCPSLDVAYINQAIDALNEGYQVVIGPAEDGGYVLLGMKQADPSVFDNIEWGSPTVFADTCRNISGALKVLDLKWDVDRLEDLTRLGENAHSVGLSRDFSSYLSELEKKARIC